MNNLPLVHGTHYWEDVLTFFANYLNIKVERDSIVACHPLGPIHNPSQPPAFIVKFVDFDVKDRIWGKNISREISLTRQMQNRSSQRTVNKKRCRFNGFLKRIRHKNIRNYNSAPQVSIKKHGSKPKPHNVVDMEAADSLLAQGSLISYSKNEKILQSASRTALLNFTEGGQKQVNEKEKPNKRGMSSPSDEKIVGNLKKLKNNKHLLNQYFESIVTKTTTDQNNDIDSENGFVVKESTDS